VPNFEEDSRKGVFFFAPCNLIKGTEWSSSSEIVEEFIAIPVSLIEAIAASAAKRLREKDERVLWLDNLGPDQRSSYQDNGLLRGAYEAADRIQLEVDTIAELLGKVTQAFNETGTPSWSERIRAQANQSPTTQLNPGKLLT